ncbi:MAG TPA: VOC family protein [Candidatus Acidoferrales bacterium]|nr:VOC family protein [Candidatus Acidoferrales bacterium]
MLRRAFVAVLLTLAPLAGQPARPPIVGIAHFALKTSDLTAARAFYGRDLGFAELFTMDNPAGGGVLLALFKVNDHQYLEVRPELKDPAEDRLSHLAFETTDARRLRDYLAAKGVAVPATLEPLRDGNLGFKVKDPEGRDIEFQQLLPGGMHAARFGQSMPESRISARIIHAGLTVRDRAAADRFWHDILGFEETWHGGRTDDAVDWVDMRVPEGTDWLEYMLNVRNPTPRTLGVMHHFGLGVPSVEAAHQRLQQREVKMTENPKIGRDGKWQLNLYDPDLTRVELMEPKPVQTPCCSPMKME